MDTNTKGVITELMIQKAFIEKGFNVSIPVNPASRYDMIVDAYGGLFKVQCKTATPAKNNTGFTISTCSTHRIGNNWVHTPYSNTDVDLFATVYEDEVYVIPYDVVGNKTELMLRTAPPALDMKTINYANDYKLNNMVDAFMLPYDQGCSYNG